MIYFLLAHTFTFLLDLVATVRRSHREKDLEILLLHQQLRILQRKHAHPSRLSRWEKLGLAVLAAKLIAAGGRARSRLNLSVLLFKPETLLKWHPELVRRKWTFNTVLRGYVTHTYRETLLCQVRTCDTPVGGDVHRCDRQGATTTLQPVTRS